MSRSLFVKLLQISVGTLDSLTRVPNVHEWNVCFEEAEKQAVVGVILDGLEKLPPMHRPPQDILLQWIGTVQVEEQTYRIHCERVRKMVERFKSAGYRSCVLKGLGNALYYPNPQRRQCGDIDIWVTNALGLKIKDSLFRKSLIEYLQKHGQIGSIDIKHCDWKVFDDTPVEVHFIPTWFYNPFVNRQLKRWLEVQQYAQFENKTEFGFCVPTTSFNLVYVLIHIYRHLFDEGVGLRQLLDYYYILIHSTEEERTEAMSVLCSFKMKRFVGAIMFVLQEVFKMDGEYLMCKPLRKDGRFLLDEIMRAGNFGHYDERNKNHHQGRLANGIKNIKRNLRFVGRYPQEVCWMPAWKIWHWCWRKKKGYL